MSTPLHLGRSLAAVCVFICLVVTTSAGASDAQHRNRQHLANLAAAPQVTLQARGAERLSHLQRATQRACAAHERTLCRQDRAQLAHAVVAGVSDRRRGGGRDPVHRMPTGAGSTSSAGGGSSGASSAPPSSSPSSTTTGAAGSPAGGGSTSSGGSGLGNEPLPGGGEASTATAGFEPGINSGTEPLDLSGAADLGAKIVRVAFEDGTTPAQMEPVIAAYAAEGIRVAPLLSFYGSMPTPAQAQALAGWARAFGPGGTFWAHRSDGQLAIRTIEFGNETSGGYQYGDNAGEPSYQARAATYAVRLREAAEAVSATGAHVGLLAVAEDWTGDWMNGMFGAVPNLGRYVAGWVSHPYGTEWRSKIEDILAQSAAHGASAQIPIDVTEWGLATDNGRCLSQNFGYTACMTYAEAATTERTAVSDIRQLLGSRAGLFLLYQVRDQRPTGTGAERETYCGLLQHEDQPKGAYTTATEALLAG